MNELAKNDVEVQGGMVKFNTASDMIVFAEQVHKSQLAPSGFKTPQAIFVAIQQGAELGMKPMQSLQGIAVINGRTSLYDKTARGLALSSKQVESLEDRFEGSGDDFAAITTIKRKGVTNPFIGRFSVKDAKTAQLWGKAGPWTNYPKDMLSHKASSRALNAGFSDVLIGLPIFEDIQDLPPEKKAPENPTPTHDPLLDQVPLIRQMMDHKSNNPTRDGASIIGEPEIEYDNMGLDGSDFGLPDTGATGPIAQSASEPIPIHPDDLDYAQSQAKSQPAPEANLPAGANTVEGEMIVYAPKTEKQPWTIVIGGIKMAVWRKSLPVVVAQFEKGNLGKGKNMRADYTTEVGPKYTNHTCVNLESVK